jgi:hypothetical protein
MPRSLSFPLSSASVVSGCCTTTPRMKAASASMRRDLRSPPWFLGTRARPERTCATQRIALDALTPNRAAAWRHDLPLATASTTRSQIQGQRSSHACWPPSPACSLNHSQADSGIPLDSIRSEFALGEARASRPVLRAGPPAQCGSSLLPKIAGVSLAGCLSLSFPPVPSPARISVLSSLLEGYDEPEILPSSSR